MWNFWLVTVAKERSAEKLIIEMGGGGSAQRTHLAEGLTLHH